MLRDVEGLEIPFQDNLYHSAHQIFPVLLPESIDRAAFMEALQKKGLQTSIHYPPVHRFSYYRNKFDQTADDLKWTEYAGQHEVTLQLYPSLKEAQVEYIVDAIKEIL
jgi:dTDP-4-amino-4,6-dideoxygalactose transaminase